MYVFVKEESEKAQQIRYRVKRNNLTSQAVEKVWDNFPYTKRKG